MTYIEQHLRELISAIEQDPTPLGGAVGKAVHAAKQHLLAVERGNADVSGSRITVYEDPGGGWSALYLDGEHVSHGDHHNVIEKLVDLTGVDWRQDKAFLVGGRDVARTVREVEERVRQREADREEADNWEAEARNLMDRATAQRHKWS